ncbi:MAG: hypothetical protein ACE5JZ_02855 [Kiloniellales bacterium]
MAEFPIQDKKPETIPLPGRRPRVETPPDQRRPVSPRPAAASPAPSRPGLRGGVFHLAVRWLLSGPALAAVWLVGCFAYFHFVIGWEVLPFLLPHEIAGFLAGSIAPLALIWLVTSYRRRGMALERTLDALQRTVAQLTYPAEGAEGRVQEITEALRRQSEMLTGASDHALSQVRQIEANFRQHCHDMGEAAEHAAAQARFVRETLHQQYDRLAAMSEQMVQRSNDVFSAVSRQTGELDKALDQAADQASQIGAAISAQGEALSAAAKRTADWAAELDNSIRKLGPSLEASVEKAAQGAGEISRAIERHSKQLDGAAGRMTAFTEDMVRSLRQRLDELLGSTNLALAKIGEVGDAFRQRTQELPDAADQAASRTAQAEEGHPRPAAGPGLAQEIPSLLQRPASAPARSMDLVAPGRSRAASDGSAPVTEPPIDFERRDAFLRSASFVVDNLNSISIDLNRVLERDIPRRVWRAFYNGDKSAFTRRILSLRGLRDLRRIRRRYRQDPEFRKHAAHYITEFENLLDEAGKWDYENLLGTTFLTADVGKLYLLLSRAVGREVPR